jgi:pimeloyl-ACP methyl ester carboxylesterase
VGGEDLIVPLAHAEWLADNIPGAKFRFLPDEGHVSLLNKHSGAILEDLIERGAEAERGR